MKRYIIATALAAAAIGQASADSYNGLLTEYDLRSAGNASSVASIVAHFRSAGDAANTAHAGGRLGERDLAPGSETSTTSSIAAHFRSAPSANGDERGRPEYLLIGKGWHGNNPHANSEATVTEG
ncbi:hypothetical protein QWY84_19840 [Aquisalimonas lutea]|uniref:hypothetical protein n=1 Tax=Aquisalimonas lutea TaxID=1327750 RepID=UPI0025B38E16|nr:hypothetical protein [Aquisalimonas lutea]MDN3519861.1 hypothetical protein [Aquisalimonas lutea]